MGLPSYICGAGSQSQLIFGIALLSWLPYMLWWCETKKNHFDISCILPKAQQQLDEPANIAISSQIPLTHQVNTYVLVVGMCGQAFYMEIIYVLSNNWNKIHANYHSICFVENQESMPACTTSIYIYIYLNHIRRENFLLLSFKSTI